MTNRRTSHPAAGRAATLLAALGERETARILRTLDAADRRVLAAALVKAETQSSGTVSHAADIAAARSLTVDRTPSTTRAHGTDRRYAQARQGIAPGASRAGDVRCADPLAALAQMSPSKLAQALSAEHPQVCAAMIAQLDKVAAARVLRSLPDRFAADVATRVGDIGKLSRHAIGELQYLASSISTHGRPGTWSGAGAVRVGDGASNRPDHAAVGRRLEEDPTARAEAPVTETAILRSFDGLLAVNDRALQAILRSVAFDVIATALRGADGSAIQRVIRNLSRRTGASVRTEMEERGPTPRSEVEAARRAILHVANKLARTGSIDLSTPESTIDADALQR